jgi:hypothetical protein
MFGKLNFGLGKHVGRIMHSSGTVGTQLDIPTRERYADDEK